MTTATLFDMVIHMIEKSKKELIELLMAQQKKIETLEKEKGRDDGLDYTVKVVYSPQKPAKSDDIVELAGE